MVFVFFKQKTAYELRMSDCSSDVCSSDLDRAPSGGSAMLGPAAQIVREELAHLLEQRDVTLEITDAARAQSLPLNQEALVIVLRNLVENAALHGPEHGVVTVDAEQEGFEFKDHGGGIAAQDRSEEPRVGKGGGRPFRIRGTP